MNSNSVQKLTDGLYQGFGQEYLVYRVGRFTHMWVHVEVYKDRPYMVVRFKPNGEGSSGHIHTLRSHIITTHEEFSRFMLENFKDLTKSIDKNASYDWYNWYNVHKPLQFDVFPLLPKSIEQLRAEGLDV